MRDFLLVATVLGLVPFILRRPHVGVLAYAWLSYMNPHRLTWGFAHDLPFAQAVMAVTLAGLALTCARERPVPAMSGAAWLLLAFAAWVTLTTQFAKVPDQAGAKWDTVMKIMLVTFLTLGLFREPARIRQLVWVIALSVGFYGVKGGLATLATAGGEHVVGPPSTFIEDNNALALALVMATPLLYFCAMSAPRRWLRLSLLGAVGLNVLGVLGTYSRGGLLALAAMGAVLWLYSRNKLVTGALVLSLGLLGLFFMPGEWLDRMNSIGGYEQDESAQERLRAWDFAKEQAAERPLIGGGFKVFALNTQDKGANGEDALNAHSIYYEVLGEHGYPGLCLFLAFLLAALWAACSAARGARGRDDLAWAALLGRSLQAVLAGYAVGGAFLTLGFFDLYYHVAAIALLTRLAVRQAPAAAEVLETKPFTAPSPWPITVPAFVGRTWPAPGGQNGS